MVKLEKIQSHLFPNLYESFLKDDDPLSNQQDWRNVFDYQWPTDHDHCGYALLDNDRVVGMIGMVFSERLINGEKQNLCNLHTWWVHPDHRGRSLALLRPVLKLNDYTITHFTPDAEVRAVTKRLGFSNLNSQLKILLPLRKQNRPVTLLDDCQEIAGLLDEHERRILDDHLPYDVGHLCIVDGHESCYVVYTHVVRHRLPYCHVHYVGNHAVFARHEPAIRNALISKHRARFVAVDCRLVADISFPRSFNFWAPEDAVYRPVGLGPQQIDHLYSDVVFLKLTTLPDLSHEVGRIWRRYAPRFLASK